MEHQHRTAILSCLFCVLILAGCAKPRASVFDVPSAIPKEGTAASSPSSQDTVRTGARSRGENDSVTRAAAEIAAAMVFFDFDKYAIRQDTRKILDTVADLLKRNPSIRICLHGHCDARGPNEYNYALGERRARAVYGYLTKAGVPAIQLEMVTHGKKNPVMSGETESAYARNRRVELIVMTTCF